MDKNASHRKIVKHRKKEDIYAVEIAEAWDSYFAKKDQKSRDYLVEKHLHLVDNVARAFIYKKPTVFDMSDIKQAGVIGLMDAITKFDLSKEAKFKTYAQIRIHGSILDAINKLDWTPRSVRKNIRDVIRAGDSFRESNFREANIDDLAIITNLSRVEVELALRQSLKTFILPVEHNSLADMESSMKSDLSQKSFSTLSTAEDMSDFRDVRIALQTELTKSQMDAIEYRYFQERTLAECSKLMGISIKDFKVIIEEAILCLQEHFNDSKEDD